ncbi:MAG: thioredoxin domain-containing protein, partial [Verrucomicrobia bacterium]|nr:thioredoxin domain-containing protein [Verrucomicrobiota bacterium]
MNRGIVVSLALAGAVGLAACRQELAEPRSTVIVTDKPAAAVPAYTNRLAREKSPYLLQHQHNPVDWYAWGEEAFARARQENRPIFLSIGYSTCHWCHVMERESFESPEVAGFLNAHFVSIKVDREERPDVDKIYMTFIQATSGQGGWPLNVFLTPELKPFYGGTYFPPDNRYGRQGFLQILQHIQELWQKRQAELTNSAEGIQSRLEQLTISNNRSSELVLNLAVVRDAGTLMKHSYDAQHGGFGGAPKFPQPSQPQFLLRYARRVGDEEAVRMVLHTCDRMAAGGIHDHLGGGFARYAVDAEWLVPHFEKMLYDNAQLVQLYLDAYLVSGEARHAEVARDILDYVLRDMTHPDGGFYSAEDADSEGHEGKFYCWTRAEMARLLTPEEFGVAARYVGITEQGNFVDHSHPQPLPNQNVLSIADPALTGQEKALLASVKTKLSAARALRIRPLRDDKVLASWNGLMLGAMARASVVLGDDKYRAAAERNLAFLKAKLWDAHTKTLYHRWRDGERDNVQLLEGYAFLLAGVIDLYEANLTAEHLDFAIALAETMVAKFYDPEAGGFWQSAAGAKDLILRVKEDYDGAEPSGNSVAIFALLKVGKIIDRKAFMQAAEQSLRLFAHRLHEVPQAVPYMLQALDFSLDEPWRAVVAGDPSRPDTRALLRAIHSVYQPHKVVLGNHGPVEPFARTIPAKGDPLVYLCSGNACQPPTS